MLLRIYGLRGDSVLEELAMDKGSTQVYIGANGSPIPSVNAITSETKTAWRGDFFEATAHSQAKYILRQFYHGSSGCYLVLDLAVTCPPFVVDETTIVGVLARADGNLRAELLPSSELNEGLCLPSRPLFYYIRSHGKKQRQENIPFTDPEAWNLAVDDVRKIVQAVRKLSNEFALFSSQRRRVAQALWEGTNLGRLLARYEIE